MTNNEDQHPMSLVIESVNNFLKKQKETETRQLEDNSEGQILGDPLTDVKMNQTANNLGSDGDNAPTVSVTPGAAKGGDSFETGQPQAQFHDKTKLAENEEIISEKEIRAYIVTVLKEQLEAKLKEEETVDEAVSDELLGDPSPTNESELDEVGRSHSLGRVTNAKPQNYPKNLQR